MTRPLATVLRYWETVRRLRAKQIYGRLWFRLTKPRITPQPAPTTRTVSGAWAAPARRRPSLVAPQTFRLLNQEGELSQRGWEGSQGDKLWRYNQHYFDDLNAHDAAARREWHRALLADWLIHNAPCKGTAWDPYPTSLRIVNWIKWALGGEQLNPALLDSLATQARWLFRRLEFHLLGNHLFANAKALVFAGLWFDGDEADRWRRKGSGILSRETGAQILGDGGQFELSPMYHALALEDVLDLINVSRAFPSALGPSEQTLHARWREMALRMRAWLAALSHPDGEIAFFNDAAFGAAPHREELETYATRLDLPAPPPPAPLTRLAASGYARLEQPEAVLICDMAPIGPDHLPGHAHADTLSFEFSLFGRRLFVNSGTSLYGTGPERLRQRSTPAHNTVTVANQNSSDVWSGFRVGRRARPIDARVSQVDGVLEAEASHNGHAHLPGRPIHHRRWRLAADILLIEDTVSTSRHPSEARFHLHPDIKVHQDSPQTGRFELAGGQTARWRAESTTVRLEATTWHPEFGLSIPTVCLAVPFGKRTAFEITWRTPIANT